MIKNLLTKSRALFSIGVLAALLTVAIAAIVLLAGRGERGNWGSLWGVASEVKAADLPHEARAKLRAIKAGGPFEYREDGIVFRNREKKLPIKRRGFYRVYIVPTPGVKGLGERRIISGCEAENDCRYWYTSDGYEVLHRIRE